VSGEDGTSTGTRTSTGTGTGTGTGTSTGTRTSTSTRTSTRTELMAGGVSVYFESAAAAAGSPYIDSAMR
jgi:hypothetical protein